MYNTLHRSYVDEIRRESLEQVVKHRFLIQIVDGNHVLDTDTHFRLVWDEKADDELLRRENWEKTDERTAKRENERSAIQTALRANWLATLSGKSKNNNS